MDQNATPSVDPEDAADPDYADAGFIPSKRQVAYLLAVEDALATRQSITDVAIAASMGMSRATFIRWRQDPAFCHWYLSRMNRVSDHHWPMILRRHELSAIAGSVHSAEFIARVKANGFAPRALAEGAEAGGALIDASKHYTVNVLVQRPDDVASATLLPLDDPRVVKAQEELGR